jgi:hypothetical protein
MHWKKKRIDFMWVAITNMNLLNVKELSYRIFIQCLIIINVLFGDNSLELESYRVIIIFAFFTEL